VRLIAQNFYLCLKLISMFKGNNSNNNMSRTQESNSPDRLNRIVEGTSIQGEIRSDSNIRIDGKLKGTIATKGRLVVGPNGSIEGEVICQNADIEGTLIGKITVNELLSLKATAKLQGDIITNKLAIEPGAQFSGTCSMGGVVKKEMTPGNFKAAAEKNGMAKAKEATVESQPA
jgi:cytoskeletal protein CcmA (bactofilin family)